MADIGFGEKMASEWVEMYLLPLGRQRAVPGHMAQQTEASALPHWVPLYSANSYSLCDKLSDEDLEALKCSLTHLPPYTASQGAAGVYILVV